MTEKPFAAIVLAAGKGTRMRSDLAKVLHKVANRPMIQHVLAALAPLAPARTVVVLAPGMDAVAAAVAPATVAIQAEALGTAHAVAAAREALADFTGDVLILYGDAPLVTTATLSALLAERRRAPAAAAVVLGMRLEEPGAYGRLVLDRDGTLAAIVEAADCTADQRSITLCNSGLMAVDGRHLFGLLGAIGRDNAKGEHYLTDLVGVARRRGLVCRTIAAPAGELMGVNSRADLAAAEAALQARLRAQAMAAGVTMVAPETVFLSADTSIGRDSVIGPFVVFGPGVTVGEGVEIPAFCHIAGARIGDHASIGPFARLRPGAELEAEVHLGNFVEVKNSHLERGVKANHLSLYRRQPGRRAGPMSAPARSPAITTASTRSAPRSARRVRRLERRRWWRRSTVGDGAIIAAGSVVTGDVPADALAIARGRQVVKPGRASQWREERRQAKAQDRSR